MDLPPFVGRQHELGLLNDLLRKKTASLVVINGRRRVGKSRLVTEFAKDMIFYRFSGLAPDEGITSQDQRNEFAFQLNKQTGIPKIYADDWSKLFQLLADKVKEGRVIIMLDEVTWMAADDPTFLSKLKNAWDLYLSQNPKLILIICGSVSAWIQKNILSSTGYFGRVSLRITLKELPLPRCSQLLDALGFKQSNLEKIIFLALTGGVPWYIEQVIPNYTAEKNINRLCFDSHALLLGEFKHIFHDLFGRRSEVYEKIVQLLVEGPLEYKAIADQLGYSKGSALTDYLTELELSGYISTYNTWNFASEKMSTLRKYHLSDNFIRFYLKYIFPKSAAIKNGTYRDVYLSSLPGWSGIVGLQFENLVLKNRQLILKKLGINPMLIVADGPYFQNPTVRQKGCQVDYLIQTKMKTLYVCEVKFSQNTLGISVVHEMQEKIQRLLVPKHYVILPVLIHCNEISEALIDSDYFHCIISSSEFLDLS